VVAPGRDHGFDHLARQTAPEVLEALITAMAKVIVRAGLGSDAVEMWKGRLDSTTDFQRGILEDEREAQRHENALKMQNYKAWLANGGSYR
jgi:hypothetical protein